MRSVNKVILIGNLTRDPELRQTSNGQNVVTFGLATNRDWVTRDGRKQSMAEFHDLVAWAKLADICKQYLRKGKLIYVEGYLKTRSWDSPEGVKKFKTEIVVQDMIMLDKRTGNEAEEFIPDTENEQSFSQPEQMAEGGDGEVSEAVSKKPEKTTVKTVKRDAAEKGTVASVNIDDDLGL